MSDLGEIREMFHAIDKKLDTHVSETRIYREEKDKRDSSIIKTLYAQDTGLVYTVDRLRENEKLNKVHKKLMVTLFGVPIVGWILEALFHFFNITPHQP